MSKESILTKAYKNKGIAIADDEIIIFKEYCHDFIQSCKEYQLIILGIDGFYVKENEIKVNLLEISDFSKTKKDIENCYSLAISFIDDMLKNGKSNAYLFTLDANTTINQ